MSFPLILRPEAEQDLRSARDWYERQHAGLGARFTARASSVFDRLAEMPELFAIRWQDVRLCRLKGFPYVVYYRILSDRVEVLAVLRFMGVEIPRPGRIVPRIDRRDGDKR